ncbi:MAG TPA: hypothetical protein VLF39_01185 [Candidatus Saccharimonadales bacterium]|nr:hypothetical protein [Candidatus Saccharimonadales bacterium]
MIDPAYKQIHNKALQLQYTFQDLMDEKNPTASMLHREAKQLVDEVEMQKNPRDLESRIKMIQNQIKMSEHQGTHLMSLDHAQSIHENYEHLRQDIRGLSNYS